MQHNIGCNTCEKHKTDHEITSRYTQTVAQHFQDVVSSTKMIINADSIAVLHEFSYLFVVRIPVFNIGT